MQFYGWYQWTRGPVEHARSLSPIKRLGQRGWIGTAGGVTVGTAVLGTAMHRYTNAALPYPDAFTTMLSVFAQFLMTKKYLENWTLWIVADVIYIGVYGIKSLYWTCGLYAVFLALCVQGYREWRGSMHYLRRVIVSVCDRTDERRAARRRHDGRRAVNRLPDDLVQLQIGRHVGVLQIHPQRRGCAW